MNFLKMKKKVASVVAAAMITTTLVPMGAIAMAENQTEKKAVKIVQTAGRDQLGEFAPEFARYNDDILFGEVWSRNDKLSLRDRRIVTVCSLIGSGVIDSSLKYHLATAKKNGVTQEEMAEIITQLGFYVGWPKAWAAFNMAKEVYAE
ncbi:carboxymuconolactone decarboxylase family protein [Megasphaera sp. SW808]|uniref:carboxymuconolactone decarboxylase family protein n=1 Tax=Megasphaera sp. SW808 TaxID=2530045 RepID=UPI001F118B0E|nr:carboxymuconolactone decarboxylase family protein [Megasphaera sp. SW808]